MYVVDGNDKVVELKDLPQSCVGAPCPVVLAGEHHLCVSYFLQDTPTDWDGRSVSVVGPGSHRPAAIVRFSMASASMFGPPNDEAFTGHPLATRGLHPYGAFEVLNSSWIRRLEKMNSVHPRHRPEAYAEYRHFILAFHDTTFECIAGGYKFERVSGPMTELIARESSRLAE